MRTLLCLAALSCALSTAVQAAPASLLADHPLNGSLWDTGSGRPTNEETLLAAAAAADWVLVGEKHDNAEHHRLQARIVGALGRLGRRMAVVWEMAEPEQAEALAAARLEEVDRLGTALGWEARGWPAWAEYQPIAEAALAAQMPMLPGKPSQAQVRALAKGASLPPETAERLAWPRRYPAEAEADLLEELAASHCGKLPVAALAPMAEVQRFWDASMADAMRRATQPPIDAEGAILIAGSGHVREDRAVPWHLEGESFTVALVEVVAGRDSAADYPAFDPQLFDFVWFTPRVDDKDPCEAFPD
ncbi:ChaN family lipoprotein [Pelagibius marinus]|uniref:ChaN family lipoprotein n=1 Tax=Pelagibius marinus TaxID=2762760 RepID=UPI00187219B9|nr:ChaN family lipoprotein [Pelagibius marinus]